MPVGWKIAAIADVRKNMQEAQNALGKYYWAMVCLFDGMVMILQNAYKIYVAYFLAIREARRIQNRSL